MTNEEKLKLMKFLYPTEKTREFMCNDLYQELLSQIKIQTCINSKNIVKGTRDVNLKLAKQILTNYINDNPNYKKMIIDLYHKVDIDDILIGYVFYLANTNYVDFDIFKDKKSICYSEISVLDIL